MDVPDSRRREVEAFALLQPPVEDLADRDADAVSASLGVLVHEVPECSVGSPGSAVEGPGELLQLAGGGVVPKRDPQLPHAVPYLALRSTHDPMVARG